MKPIENIFGFDCGTCEYNRHCYGGNMGNQFRYCQKFTEKIQNLDNLEKQNKQLKYSWNKLKEKIIDSFNKTQDVQFLDVLQDMQELEQGSDK